MIVRVLASVCVTLFVMSHGFHGSAAPPIDFNRDIRPLLSDRCFHCHGPDGEHREAGLRLDVEAAAHEGAIVPGDAEASDFVSRIESEDEDLRMPPVESGKSLKPNEVALLRRWVVSGAKYDGHWAFSPPKRPRVPDAGKEWRRNEIDAFVFRKLLDAGLQPSPVASKQTLLRRVTLDLTGLPPTMEAIQAFERDASPNAYEVVVDRLLKSDAFGERMAAVWLDAARYADTMGYQADWERYQWRWRSWVIDAYNRNLPFDQFTIQQIAGDLLPSPTTEQLIATGFNRNHRINDEGGIIPEEYLVEYIVDRVETTSATWLGLTMGCARCHDHKFDPFSQADFYRMFAFFNGVPEKGKEGRKGYADPYIRVARRGMSEEYAAVKRSVSEAQEAFARRVEAISDSRETWTKQQRTILKSKADPWNVVELAKITADGVQFESLDDGSYLGSDFTNDHPDYELLVALPQQDEPNSTITGLRLEAIPHASLSGGRLSPGQGNFYLSDFSAFRVAKDGSESRIELSAVEADYQQRKFPAKNAIDKNPQSSWAVDGHAKKEKRTVVFTLAEPVELKADESLVLRLRHDSPHAKRVIGRLRISVTSSKKPAVSPDRGLPKDVVSAVLKDPAKRKARDHKLIRDHHGSIAPATRETRAALKAAQTKLAAFEKESTTYVMVMREMDEPRPTHILKRGVYDQPGELVRAAVPAEQLGPLPESAAGNRLGLARWLVSGEHPLTSRVIVNRYWAMLFGRGLVSTLEDFGLQGEYPSHPELLDWLATEYPRRGWDTKAMIKQMVMSATYRQSSKVTRSLIDRDPKNRLLARMSRLRLPAEMIRDQALAAGGLLVQRIGGPSVKPYQPAGLWSDLSFNDKKRSTDFYVPSKGEGLYRRSLYTFWKRSVPPPTMATFDAPSREACVLERSRTNTPLQALALMNDVTYVEASRALAERAMRSKPQPHGTPDAWLAFAFRALLSRAPDSDEMSVMRRGYQRRHAFFQNDEKAAEKLLAIGAASRDTALDIAAHAALTTCVMNVMNLDESINRE